MKGHHSVSIVKRDLPILTTSALKTIQWDWLWMDTTMEEGIAEKHYSPEKS